MSGTVQDIFQVTPANSSHVDSMLALEEAQAEARKHQLMASGMEEKTAREKARASAWTGEDLYASIIDRSRSITGLVALKGKDVVGYALCERNRKQQRILRLVALNGDPAVQAHLLEYVQRHAADLALYFMADVSDIKIASALANKGFVTDCTEQEYFGRNCPAYLMQWSPKDVPHIEIDLKPSSLLEQTRYSARQACGAYKPLDPGIVYAARDQLCERTRMEWNVYCPGNDGKLRIVRSPEDMERAPGLYLMTSNSISDAKISNKRLAYDCESAEMAHDASLMNSFNITRGFLSIKALQPVKAKIPEDVSFLYPAMAESWGAGIKSESTSGVNWVYQFLR